MARQRLTVDGLDTLTIAQARQWWERFYGASAPSMSLTLLRLGLAYQIQAKAAGFVDRKGRGRVQPDVRRRSAPRRKLTPGTRLVRDWHGVGHVVTVRDTGFEYDGRQWTSLTAIARAITGAKWSGPRFFGIQQ